MSLPDQERLRLTCVLVVGDVMLDRYWHGVVDRISPEAPVPVVHVQREEDRLGGCGNVAHNVVSLGAQASLLSVVGTDATGDRLHDLLSHSGIRAELGRDPQLSTTMKLRIIGRQQQLLRADFENQPNHEVLASLTHRYGQLLSNHHSVLFSDYGKGGLTHVAEMIGQARELGLPVLIDPKGSDYSRYVGAAVITPNRAELREVVGAWRSESHLEQLAQSLRRELGLAGLLVTRSEEGMTLFDDAGSMHMGAQAREVFDVTGAGDTVIATLATLLGSGLTLRDALPWANKAGGIVVGKFGTASVTWAELSA
ncbi:MAG: D-glycero-beta-D-manno-heptose-7-phosphate kinase [Alphaproteobacteria bacterium]|nr:D-glycero-beta-D-manno-heptose-7-phosphate kinase [Alphaproteobacteria bacterium]